MRFRSSQTRYKFLLALLVSALPISVHAQERADDPAAALSPETLVAQVTIRRDNWGVPHVIGENMNAAVFGFAYAQAEDHILGIMQRALHARGELAEHFGPSQLESDLFIRRYHIHEYGADHFGSLSPEIQGMYEAFALGLNLYVEKHRDELPAWAKPVTKLDVLAMSRAGLLRFAFGRGRELQQFLESREREKNGTDTGTETSSVRPAHDVDEATNIGSNMWAFTPDRTASGNAMLLGNPHQPWNQVFYEGHVTVPGEYNLYGATFIGNVLPSIAFNDHLGWSHTVNYPDSEDYYELTLDPDQPDHYLFGGESVPMVKNEVTIKVKGDDGIEEVARVFWDTPIGPVSHRAEDKIYVVRSASLFELRYTEQWYLMGKAANLEQFREALALNAAPMFNVCYADDAGNAFYQWMARLPVRPEGQDGRSVVPAAGPDDIWQEVHPAEDMPQQLNPEGGYVQNCNDPPWYTNLSQPIDPNDFPAYMPTPRLGLRTQHSLQLVHNRRKFSLEDIVETKFSPKILLADRVRDDLVSAINAVLGESDGEGEDEAELKAAAELLGQWDGTVLRESRGSVLFRIWWDAYHKLAPQPWREPWSAEDATNTPRGLADAAKAVEALRAAIAECAEKHGSIDVAWGEVHRIRRGELDIPVSGATGGIGAFRVINYAEAADGKRVANGGDSWVFAVEFGEQPSAYSIMAYSESEDPNSAHHTDQTSLFADNRMKRVNFTEDQIARNLAVEYRPGER